MLSEYLRISKSIDSITIFAQIAPTFKWVNHFANAFKDVQGVEEKKQLLLNQLNTIEL
tara:strand:- start:1848 stop:2021 length:174 start_codon:yes stop_codon:yes gene_type:complete